MGFYLNPSNMRKEEWLRKYAHEYLAHEVVPSYTQAKERGMILVCLVDNVSFTAAGIAFSEDEREVFFSPDGRMQTWYAVSEKLILEQVPEVAEHLE